MTLRRKLIVGMILAAFVGPALIVFPIYAGTQSFPFALVEGNSMFPTLQIGDVVFFLNVNRAIIPNGTLIVFVQGQTGIPLLDSLLQPTTVHRVVGKLVQNDGQIYYITKGDNNQFNDPSLVHAANVLGSVSQDIPKVGDLLLFVQSTRGLAVTVSFMMLSYIGVHKARSKEQKRQKLVGVLAQRVFTGEIPQELFKKLEIAVKYSGELKAEELGDGAARAIVEWLKRGGLDHAWTFGKVACPQCSQESIQFQNRDMVLVICSNCMGEKVSPAAVSSRMPQRPSLRVT